MTDQRPLDRRTLLFGAGVIGLAACAGDSAGPADVEDAQPPVQSGATTPPEPDVPATDTAGTTVESPTSTQAAAETAPTTEPVSDGAAALTAADFESLSVCALLPATTAGPFPNIEQLNRRDVTEGYPGHPLRLGLRVVDAACQPLAGANVEIWHTDATGDYSSYQDNGDGKDEGAGSTFMRGYQTSGVDGIVEFMTIYPGWYQGRAVHIHVGVDIGGERVLTSQLYFDEAYTEQVLATGVYAEFGPPDTTWSSDRIVGDPRTDGSEIALQPADTTLGTGSLGLANLGVTA